VGKNKKPTKMFQEYQDRGPTHVSYAHRKLPGQEIYSSGQKRGLLANFFVHIEDLIVIFIFVHP
jgi:hypothetical protein